MEYRKKTKGIIRESDFEHIARVLFPKALQVYIGCGAEPTTHRKFIELIHLAKKHKVPDIGVVTNGQLITRDQIRAMVECQLNELTISCHGVYKENFEYFMTGSKYDRFIYLLSTINEIKKEVGSAYPKIRINYTVNTKNLNELMDFFNVFEPFNIDTLQIRPVLNIGGKYSHVINDEQIPIYNNTIETLKHQCLQNNIRLLANTTNIRFSKRNSNEKVAEAVYCYIGPNTHQQFDFEWSDMNFRKFRKATNWRKKTWRLLFHRKKSSINEAAGNYDVFG